MMAHLLVVFDQVRHKQGYTADWRLEILKKTKTRH